MCKLLNLNDQQDVKWKKKDKKEKGLYLKPNCKKKKEEESHEYNKSTVSFP